MRLFIIALCSVLLSGCAGWDWDYDPIEDEITIGTVKEGNDEAN